MGPMTESETPEAFSWREEKQINFHLKGIKFEVPQKWRITSSPPSDLSIAASWKGSGTGLRGKCHTSEALEHPASVSDLIN